MPSAVWAPKPVLTPPYPPPHQPRVALADVKARHARESNWRELIVNDGRLTGEYVAAAPGTKTDKRFHPDTREWFAVVEGELKVDIEGQPAIAARRGSLINVPRQTMDAVETVGDAPSLRFVVNVAGAKRLYPQEVTPPPAPQGTAWVPVTINRVPKYTGGRFVRDDKSERRSDDDAQAEVAWRS